MLKSHSNPDCLSRGCVCVFRRYVGHRGAAEEVPRLGMRLRLGNSFVHPREAIAPSSSAERFRMRHDCMYCLVVSIFSALIHFLWCPPHALCTQRPAAASAGQVPHVMCITCHWHRAPDQHMGCVWEWVPGGSTDLSLIEENTEEPLFTDGPFCARSPSRTNAPPTLQS